MSVNKLNPIVPIILCGGSGSRLWPLSRKSYPKQYLKLDPKDNYSLLQNTQKRIGKLKGTTDPILICNEDHRFIVAEQMKEININPKSILLEPVGKNTAPAITLASLKSLEAEEDPILLIMSSDHKVDNEDKFINTVIRGLKYAKNEKLVTFGIEPSTPETGYGYIEIEGTFYNSQEEGMKIKSFKEKPNQTTAKKFLREKRYLWNSGIFLFKANTILNELKKFHPKLLNICKNSLNQNLMDLDFQRLNKDIFNQCQDISIDVAVMEKSNLGIVIPLSVGWSDIGNWKSVWETSNKNQFGNKISGKVITKDSNDCYIRSENRLLVTLGIKNLIIVETNDAILIADQSNAQDVKDIVKELESKNIKEGVEHRKIFRPWGHYVSICEREKWQIKLIQVKPGEMLSLQKHLYRSEHWVVVKGTAKVEIDKTISELKENQSTYIPQGAIHRLSNPSKEPLILVEVQSGSYIGEDDIERLEDNYGRIDK